MKLCATIDQRIRFYESELVWYYVLVINVVIIFDHL